MKSKKSKSEQEITLGQKIKLLRLKNKMSLLQLSLKTIITPEELMEIEGDRLLPTDSQKLRLSKVLGCDVKVFEVGEYRPR